jgi:hypothetical protein
LINGRPTTVVPFFGEYVQSYSSGLETILTTRINSQPFWGTVVASNGAGPSPVPFKQLTTETLTEALRFCLQPSAKEAAQRVAAQMRREDGVQTAVKSFYRNLPWNRLVCDILPQFTARWTYQISSKGSKANIVRLSDEALQALICANKLGPSNVKPYVS